MTILRYPWFLIALLLVPLVWWAWLSTQRRAAIRFSGLARFGDAAAKWSVQARHVLPVLRTLALALLILAIARPQQADETTRITTEGIAIQLVVDRSGSMNNQDFVMDDTGRTQSRLEAVKDVVEAFVQGDGRELTGRPNDLIGLIGFALYPDTECPLTRDHAQVVRALREIRTPPDRSPENRTAIGDALLLAVERIRNIKRRFEGNQAFTIKSQAIILLTDGQQNAGKYDPVDAADVAAALGVKVYTIGAAPQYQTRQFGGMLFPTQQFQVPVEIDEQSLKDVAAKTGGKYFRAKDTGSLNDIYQEIDQLERSVVDERKQYLFNKELAYNWIEWRPEWLARTIWLPPPLAVVLGLLVIEILLANTRFRRIP